MPDFFHLQLDWDHGRRGEEKEGDKAEELESRILPHYPARKISVILSSIVYLPSSLCSYV